MLAGRSYAEGMIGELVGIAPFTERHFNDETVSWETVEVNRAVFCMQVPGIRVWNRIV